MTQSRLSSQILGIVCFSDSTIDGNASVGPAGNYHYGHVTGHIRLRLACVHAAAEIRFSGGYPLASLPVLATAGPWSFHMYGAPIPPMNPLQSPCIQGRSLQTHVHHQINTTYSFDGTVYSHNSALTYRTPHGTTNCYKRQPVQHTRSITSRPCCSTSASTHF